MWHDYILKSIFVDEWWFSYNLFLQNGLYDQTDKSARHYIIRPFRNAGLTYNEVRKLGFKVSYDLWKNCLNEEERNLGAFIK